MSHLLINLKFKPNTRNDEASKTPKTNNIDNEEIREEKKNQETNLVR